MLLTLASVRETLWKYASDKVYSTATAAQKLEVDGKINQVVERILSGCKPRHSIRRCYVPVYNSQITLPRHMQGLLGVKLVSASSSCVYAPSLIYTKFYEFAQGVNSDSCCGNGTIPVTETAQTFRDPSGEFKLRVKSVSGAAGNLTLLGGLDEDWDEYFDSVTLAITNGTTTTSRVWNKLPLIQKPTTTVGVELYSVDNTTSEETLIAVYAPGELVPAYQRYTIQGGCDSDLALIQAKLCYVPAVSDTDIIYPSVLGALKQGLRALQYEDKDDDDRSAGCWRSCFSILDKDSQELEGEAAIPIMRVAGQFGCGDILTVM